MIEPALCMLIAAATTLLALKSLVPLTARVLRLYGVDVHKPWKPRVAETGGLALLIGFEASLLSSYAFTRHPWLLADAAAVLILWCVGFLDDLVKLDAISKPLLTTLAAIPILIAHAYDPHLPLPFVGVARLTLIYPLLVVVAVMVSSNMYNMIDVLNGSMVVCALVPLLVMLLACPVLQLAAPPLHAVCLAMLGYVATLAVYLRFNWYPAQVFNGDAGSLMVGGALAIAALQLHAEALFLVSTLPLILNGFEIIVSAGGFRERSTMPRPTHVHDGTIEASLDPRAPVTLVQLIVLKGPLREPEIVKSLAVLMVLSGALALTLLPFYPRA